MFKKMEIKFALFLLALVVSIFLTSGIANAFCSKDPDDPDYKPDCHGCCYMWFGSEYCYECGDTVERSCSLDSDMVCATYGLILGGGRIQGKGHSITGSGVDTGIYSLNSDMGAMQIRDLEIKNFYEGIYLGYETGDGQYSVMDCNIHNNGFAGIHLANSDIGKWMLSGCEVHENDVGLFMENLSLHTESSAIHMFGNRICNNLYSGIICQGAFNCEGACEKLIDSNLVDGNGEGIRVEGDNWPIEGFQATANTGYGIYISGGNIDVRANTVGNNGGPGIHIGEGSENITIEGNTACNQGIDIFVSSGCSNISGDNNACENTENYNDEGTAGCIYPCKGCIGNNTSLVFRCGSLITESCTFNDDIVRAEGMGGHGFVIATDDITIDGNDYCMDGVTRNCIDGCGDGDSGVWNYDHDNVTVKNLGIKNFCNGIWLAGVNSNLIDCCEIHHNGDASIWGSRNAGIWQEDVSGTTISNCQIYHSEADVNTMAPPGGHGIYLCGGNDNLWTGNEIYENKRCGIFFRCAPERTEISHNHVHDNSWSGIRAQCVLCQDGTFKYNYCHHNRDDYGCGGFESAGIFIGGMGGGGERANTACYNVCNYNEGHGICWSRSASYGCMYENTCCENTLEDVWISNYFVISGDGNTCGTFHCGEGAICPGCAYACGDQPGADFSAEQTEPLTVLFTDLSTQGNQSDPIDSWHWDFGDCSEPGTEQNPTHLYAKAGIYNVCLFVTDDKECENTPCESGYQFPCEGTEGRRDAICKEVTVTGGGEDADGDGVPDSSDNCRLTPNPLQEDTDSDSYGNWCDCDLDNDWVVGASDYSSFCNAWQTPDPDADFDCDGVVGASDYGIFCARWLDETPFE